MKRALILAAVLLPAGWVCARGKDTTYTVKVVTVDHEAQLLEARFMVMPEDLRLVCHGDAKKVFVGDYAKVEYKGADFAIAGTICKEVKWLR